MDASIDTSEVRALGSRMKTAGARVGAKHAIVFRKTMYGIEADAKVFSAKDTGAQANSIFTTITGDGRTGTMTGESGPTTDYSPHQEHGTSTQPGTPFMGPAFDRRVPSYTEALAKIAADETL